MSSINYDLFDYFKAVLPLTVAHLAIPPLSTFQLFQTKGMDVPPESITSLIAFLRTISPSFLLTERFISSLLLERIDVNCLVHKSADLWSYRLITHMFVHKDYQHMINNVISLIVSGSPIFLEFGYTYFYFIFIAGGITASLPVYRAVENAQQAYKQEKLTFGSLNNSSSVIEVFNQGIRKVASKIAAVVGIDRKFICCGSSGGVCAIMGASFVVQCKRSVTMFTRLYKIVSEGNSSNNPQMGKELIDIGMSLLSFSSTLKFLLEEYSLFRKQDWSDVWSFFSSSNVDLVNHEAHLQGFLFGAMVTLASYGISSSTPVRYLFGSGLTAISSWLYSKRPAKVKDEYFKGKNFRTLK
jgi:membrane associated rhomboid family serine protease